MLQTYFAKSALIQVFLMLPKSALIQVFLMLQDIYWHLVIMGTCHRVHVSMSSVGIIIYFSKFNFKSLF